LNINEAKRHHVIYAKKKVSFKNHLMFLYRVDRRYLTGRYVKNVLLFNNNTPRKMLISLFNGGFVVLFGYVVFFGRRYN